MSELFVDGAVVKRTGSAILYGAGQVGRDVCRVLTEAGIHVVGMLDRRAPGGETYLGVPIHSLESCPVPPNRRDGIPVVISIFNRDVDVPELARTLRSHGFTKIVSFVHLHAAFADALGDRFWLTRRSYVESRLQDVGRAEQIWADEESRALYRSLIALRRSGEYSAELNPCPGQIQYFPTDVPGWLSRTPLRFVDCGAYRGDTLEEMISADRPVEASAHFEPDIENFAILVELVRKRLGHINGSVLSWPCAVSDRSGLVRFQHGRQEASSVSTDGDASVTAVALDDVLVGWRPTFIKMDIEGSEIEALHGAKHVIAENRPNLAVCVYHRPDHLWRIPLLLSDWPDLGGYRYFLRSHGFNGFDIVLYALPDQMPSGLPTSRKVQS